jgi:FKBP-type peptidyl-prolyl cis-trans isomerase (trigger factor)
MAEQCAKEAIALQAIAQKENIQITEEEAKASLQQEAEAAGAASVDEYIEKFGGTMGDLKLNLMYDKVYDFIIENALITES